MAYSKHESIEVKIVSGIFKVIGAIFKGFWWLIRWPFTNKHQHTKGKVLLDRVMVQDHWQEIEMLVKQGSPSRLKSAIIEADKLLDHTLRARGFAGENTGERLKAARRSMSANGYEAAWRAHKLRNHFVHEIDAEVLSWEVQKGINNFRQALKELGMF